MRKRLCSDKSLLRIRVFTGRPWLCGVGAAEKENIPNDQRKRTSLPHTALNNFYFVSCDTFFQPIIRCAGGFLCIRVMKRRYLLRDMRIPISSVSRAVLP